MSTSRSTSVQTKLLGALALGLTVILFCALGGLASAWLSLSTEVPPQVQRAADAERVGREFRAQVQEWKNVLIRGNDPAMLEKHLKAFKDNGAQVQTLATQLADGIDDPDAAKIAREFAQQQRRCRRITSTRWRRSPNPVTTRMSATPRFRAWIASPRASWNR